MRVGTSTSVRVPARTEVARFAATRAGDDVEVAVYRAGRRVATSTGAAPEVTLTAPARGTYRVDVRERSEAAASPATATLSTWVVPQAVRAARAPRITLSTDAVGFVPGRAFRYSASWRGLKPADYLGVVRYGDSGRRTLLEVDSR